MPPDSQTTREVSRDHIDHPCSGKKQERGEYSEHWKDLRAEFSLSFAL